MGLITIMIVWVLSHLAYHTMKPTISKGDSKGYTRKKN
jgi:hypothetical protein